LKKIQKALLLILVVVLALAIPANALEIMPRASKYISSYYADTFARANGDISMSFDITGVGRVDTIGADYIYLYEVNGGSIKRVAIYDQTNTPELIATNAFDNDGTLVYTNAISGRQYYAVVKFVAGKNGGSDTRNYTTVAVTAK
jgi:hypothetical protein